MTRSRTAKPTVATAPRAIALTVNGAPVRIAAGDHVSLLRVLREDLALTGTKQGCNRGQCGACTVLVDGVPRYSCLLLAVLCEHAEVRTIEGLAAPDGSLHPVQQAFLDEHGFQCGFCTPGLIMSTVALAENGPRAPDDAAIGAALGGHACRCGNYQNIIRAARLAIARVARGTAGTGE